MDILHELDIKENWLVKGVLSRKLKYFGHIKRHGGFEKTVLKGAVCGRRIRGRPSRRWIRDIEDVLSLKAYGTEEPLYVKNMLIDNH